MVLLIIGMSVVSLAPRMLPIGTLSRLEFPERLQEWLSYIPAAVLGSLLAMSILIRDKALAINISNQYIWAFIPTFVVAVFTRNLFYTLAVGIGCMALINNFL